MGLIQYMDLMLWVIFFQNVIFCGTFRPFAKWSKIYIGEIGMCKINDILCSKIKTGMSFGAANFHFEKKENFSEFFFLFVLRCIPNLNQHCIFIVNILHVRLMHFNLTDGKITQLENNKRHFIETL